MSIRNQSRTGFLTLAGAGGAAVAPWSAMAADGGEPDLVVFNANIYTVDARAPRAQAFALKAGRFVAANQRIAVADALRVNTLNGVFASHEEDIKGSITPGKLAAFAVLADDLFTVPQDKIKDIQIVRMVTGGVTMYQA